MTDAVARKNDEAVTRAVVIVMQYDPAMNACSNDYRAVAEQIAEDASPDVRAVLVKWIGGEDHDRAPIFTQGDDR